jgi:hypothetical protein
MRNDGSHNPAMIQRLEQGAGRDGYTRPRLADAARTGQGGFTHSLIGNLASLARIADLCDRLRTA